MGNPDPQSEGRRQRPDAAGARIPEILRGASPSEVLRKIFDGDPLELLPRCEENLREQAILLDPSRLHLRAIARVAHAARRYDGAGGLDVWLRGQIERCVHELTEEDREFERQGLPAAGNSQARYAFVADVLGVETALARRACVAFNALPLQVRSVWFAMVVDGKSLHQCVAEGAGSTEQVLSRLRTAFVAIEESTREGESGTGGP